MVMLILHAAKIYETSSETVRVLGDVPSDNNVTEIRYFREFLSTNRVALTGRGYFPLTKRLLLTVRKI